MPPPPAPVASIAPAVVPASAPVPPLPAPPPPAASPSLPPKPVLAYEPRRRTPAGSVLIPLTAEEIQMYRTYVGTGTRRLSKRKRPAADDQENQVSLTEEYGEDAPRVKRSKDVGLVVDHYNARPEVGVQQRRESPIIGLRNFNNWIKSVLITRFAHPALQASPFGRGKVLDMGCGKGGDLSKWSKARVREYVGVGGSRTGLDIAAISVEQARGRYEGMTRGPRFEATFAALDCFSESLARAIPPARLVQPFDVVSLQFCMHYAFESIVKARCMLENASRWLRKGGVFVGTIPNAEQLLHRLDAIPPGGPFSFGNNVYRIRFDDQAHRPIFGHKYYFFLRDAVDDVPEYIVRWDSFIQLAAEYGLYPVYKKEFHEVFEEHHDHPEFGPLMERMKVVDAEGESQMDDDQWEAANIYIAFALEKR
ncbi:hypothetical protein EW146_g10343 [Bondarzewia mesenterica]|uniref:mRNA cap guanine-N(7) methyltransferase n=1 Tax=Bondarzewia mesenterica TaxID=1095465 RepID=A0A4S4KYL5_9AGAM|nr:hypothetical protein EW146_g10343 [Bondarzewia mesenterica]